MSEFNSHDYCRNEDRPEARRLDEFEVATVGRDTIVLFDCQRTQYHSMNAIAYEVWRLCDGSGTLLDIKEKVEALGHHITTEMFELGIMDLQAAGLLRHQTSELSDSTFVERRRVLKLIAAGFVGGVVLPTVASITAPDSASAISNCGSRSPGDPCSTTPGEGCTSCCCCGTSASAPQGSCSSTESLCIASGTSAACI